MKSLVKLGSVAIMAALLVPSLAFAREDEPNDDSTIRASVQASTSAKIKVPLPGEKIRDLKAKIDEKREDRKEMGSSTATSTRPNKMSTTTRERLDAGVKERFGKFIDQVVGRFDAAIERFEKIVVRIESRIAKFDSMGGNTTEAKSLLVDAKAKIVVAKTSIAEVSATAHASTTLADLKGSYPAVKKQFEEAKDDVKAAHAALVDVIESLKGVKIKAGATTTATTTVN